MTFPRYMDGKNMFVPLASWEALNERRDEQSFSDMIEAARATIRAGGAFTVYRESDTATMLRCDRLSDLDDAIDER